MSVDLSSLSSRLRVMLDDPEASIWSQAVLEECLRLGLVQVQEVCPYALSIAGLDEAQESNLDEDICLSPLVLRLAQQHALHQRQIQRSERYHPDPHATNRDLQAPIAWDSLQIVLDRVRLYFLQRSSTTPF